LVLGIYLVLAGFRSVPRTRRLKRQ
jgi:hypothetical protein